MSPLVYFMHNLMFLSSKYQARFPALKQYIYLLLKARSIGPYMSSFYGSIHLSKIKKHQTFFTSLLFLLWDLSNQLLLLQKRTNSEILSNFSGNAQLRGKAIFWQVESPRPCWGHWQWDHQATSYRHLNVKREPTEDGCTQNLHFYPSSWRDERGQKCLF